VAAAVIALAAGAATSTLGQNALGDGRTLDNNLRTGSGGLNAVIGPGGGHALDNNLRVGSGGWNDAGRNFRAELAFRNAIVTGNVGGGREFRGSVGYTATDDFRGFLGSNQSFQFERDSFYSGLATRNLSGIDSIRNPLAYTVAGQRDTVFGGGLIVNRSGVGATAGQVDGSTDVGSRGTDVFGNISGTLRSPSSQVTRWQRMPEMIAYANEPDASGTFDVMSASPLIGIKSMRSNSPLFNPDDSARRRERERAALPGTTVPGTTIPGLPGTVPGAGREEPVRVPSAHQVVLERLRGEPAAVRATTEARTQEDATAAEPRGVGAPDEGEGEDERPTGLRANQLEMPKFDENLETLRSLLQNTNARTIAADEAAARDAADGEAEEDSEDRPARPKTAPELAAEILAGKSALVMDLAVVPTEDEIFLEHMRRGQAMLEAERWFDAEERFTAALAIRPGDPIAAAARVHAQVSAGMFRSAAVNLRNLYNAYPEMIVTRFDRSLRGSPERLERIKAQLRARLDSSSPMARDCALLLAAMGYQNEDPELIAEGFGRMRTILQDMGVQADTLERTLFAVWMGIDATPVPDAPAPEAPADAAPGDAP
jgi:hypothetical protein